ncbi:isoleucine--tRNA ligase [bacterium]|nr:isoleucine--tRNA ligase [bacterium]
MKVQKPQSKINFPELEKTVLNFWKENQVFQKSIEQRQDAEPWSFYDGPPFATGLPHYGHLLAGMIKDVIPRFWAMKGKKIERRFGWDCHGLPVEFEVEKQLGLKGRQDIVEHGVAEFNETCRSIVLRYTQEWRETVERMGRWIDFDNDYKTMDPEFMESVWAVFKQLWEKGLIYEDKKVLPYSTPIASPLSNFEANLNYQDVQDPSVYVKFKLKDQDNSFFLVWTTTPWTLPANLAIAVNPDMDYVKVKVESEQWYIHADLFESVVKKKAGQKDAQIVETLKGKDLLGLKYEQLIPGFEDLSNEQSFTVYPADYVTADSGTGLVHIAPAFGEEDFAVGKNHGLEVLDHLDNQGYFIADNNLAAGEYFKDANKTIIAQLKNKDQLLLQETIQHSYPFCYRSDTPLIYRAISTWFVNVTSIKDKLIANNQQVHWVPEHVKDGRFGKWLENVKDWAISRNRFWGNPIPVWVNEETGEKLCVGSIAELEQLTGKKVNDIHKHFIDDLEIVSPKTGDILKRVPHVLDCWFESGSMPYAQNHYPFEMSDEQLNKVFPADFIAEGLDQTRGWFYTLMVLSTALFDKPAYKNVVVNGIVLAEDGRKMSKRLKNYPEPSVVLDEIGADALRLYLMQSGAVAAEDMKFSKEGMQEVVRKVLLPVWNAYSFFATYAAVDEWDPETDFSQNFEHELDQWILLKLKNMQHEINNNLSEFKLQGVMPAIHTFLDCLNNWYIRRSRRRFWKSENDGDKQQAFSCLYTVLVELSKCLAPSAPFFSDYLYQNLSLGHALAAKISVHLEDFSDALELTEEERTIERKIDLTRELSALGRELREKLKIKVRQPLATLYIGFLNESDASLIEDMLDTIKEELNVKNIQFETFSNMVSKAIKPNFKKVGKALGAKMKAFAQACKNLSTEQIETIAAGEALEIDGELYPNEYFVLELAQESHFKHECSVADQFVIAFDENLSEDLIQEGQARELINRVQNFRKESGLNVEDRINLAVHAEDEKVVHAFSTYIKKIEQETLSNLQLKKEGIEQLSYHTQENIDDVVVHIGLEKS